MNKKKKNKRMLSRYDGHKYDWWQFGKILAIFIVVVFLVFRFVIGLSVVSGHSMDTTLSTGEIVVYNRLVKSYEPGDIVAIKIPSEEYYVKRVIAVGGDTVDIEDGLVYVNGVALTEDYAITPTEEQEGMVEYPYTVSEGDIFVLGDNRPVSMDSRTIGAVNTKQVKGKLVLKIGRFYINKIN